MTDERYRGIVCVRYVSLSYEGHVASKWFIPFAFRTVNVYIYMRFSSNIKFHCRDATVRKFEISYREKFITAVVGISLCYCLLIKTPHLRMRPNYRN